MPPVMQTEKQINKERLIFTFPSPYLRCFFFVVVASTLTLAGILGSLEPFWRKYQLKPPFRYTNLSRYSR